MEHTDVGNRPLGLTAKAVGKTYGRREVLRDVTVSVGQGITVLLGPNGAGKSTLCRIMSGAEGPTRGSIGSSIGLFEDAFTRRQHLAISGWLPQSISVPHGVTVSDFLIYAGWLKGLGRNARVDAVSRVLAATNLLDRQRTPVSQLSGGMLRRLGIAQALICDPSFVILDEPTAGLDPQQRDSLYDLLQRSCEGRVVLVSTHLLEDVHALAQNIVVLDHGQVRFDGTADQFYRLGVGADSTERARSAFLGMLSSEPS